MAGLDVHELFISYVQTGEHVPASGFHPACLPFTRVLSNQPRLGDGRKLVEISRAGVGWTRWLAPNPLLGPRRVKRLATCTPVAINLSLEQCLPLVLPGHFDAPDDYNS